MVAIIAVIAVIGIIVAYAFSGSQSSTTDTTTTDTGVDGPNEEQPLPVSNAVYSIDFAKKADGSNDTSTVVIDADIGYRNAAIDELNEVGIDPSDVTIKFENYENPFNAYE